MSEAGSIGAGQTGNIGVMSPAAGFASQAGEISNVHMASETQTTSVSGFVSQSSTTARNEFNTQMAALVMALIDMLFGKDDEEEKQKAGMMVLLAMAGSMQAQSSASYVEFHQASSTSMLMVEQTSAVAYGQAGDATQSGPAAPVGTAIDISG